MPQAIEDSVVVITGASSGIGWATAHAFAERGASVALAARSEESLREVAERILRCAQDPRREVTEGRAGQVIETLHALVPGLYGRILPHVFERAVFSSEPAEPGPGNLFEPIPEWNRLTGGWRKGNTVLRRTALTGGAAFAGAGLLAGVGYALLRRS